MRPLLQHILIFSVFDANKTLDTNADSHTYITGLLDRRVIAYKEVTGSYNHVKEKSIIIDAKHLDLVKNACFDFKQDSYLERFSDGTAQLVFLAIANKFNLEPLQLGSFTATPELIAKKSGNYTLDTKTNTYYTCH